MSLEDEAEKYFSNMNSMASRMYEDMRETKMAYENLWDTISEKEQKQILSESIIKPEVSIRYKEEEKKDIKEYAVKFIVDDNCTYRDEHSGPFSFKTLSQMDFTILSDGDKLPQKKIKPKPKPKQKKKVDPIFMDDFNITDCNRKDTQNSDTDTLPKTGLDFLDNW